MNEIMEPSCNRLLATFFQSNFEDVREKCHRAWRYQFVPSGHWISCRCNRRWNRSFPFLLMPLKRKLKREASRVQWDFQSDLLKICARQRRVWRRKWGTRTSKFLVALMKLDFPETSLRDSHSLRSLVERNFRKELCPRASLTPLAFHNVSFQSFINYY